MKSTARIGVFPAWEENPYLNYLYLAARSRGYETRPTTTIDGAEKLLAELGPGDAFHLHWTAPIVQKAETVDEARERLARFVAAADESRGRGTLLVWTIHNVLPHDAKFLEVEFELCRYLAATADMVHVLSPATASMTAPHYVLDPDRILHIPHPSYQGVYPTSSSRSYARAHFGLDESQRAILFFGQMRPYKGLESLFTAVDAIGAALTDPVLLLAGRTRPEDLPEIERTLPTTVRVVRDHSFIPDAQIERWFRAADVAVFPYRTILNSGSLHLAATFGVRAIVPAEPHLLDEFEGEDWVAFFDPENPAESIAALLRDETTYESPATSESFSRRLSPWAVSSAFADAIAAPLAAVAAAAEAAREADISESAL